MPNYQPSISDTFRYDDAVQYLISIAYLLAYEGGPIEPGDDMRGSQYRWCRLDELLDERVKLIVPRDQKWMAARAIELYRLWKDQSVDLQPTMDPSDRTKYSL